MTWKQSMFAIAWSGLVALGVGCNKPSNDDCRKAIVNMQTLIGTENQQTDLEGEVRRCRGGSSREAVDCAIKATTLDELQKCEFYRPAAKPAGSGSGSAAK